jgi:hypothetical protein
VQTIRRRWASWSVWLAPQTWASPTYSARKQAVMTLIDALARGWFFGVVSMFVALVGKE